MAYRPDAPAFVLPALLADSPIVGMSTDDEPETNNDGGALEAGTVWIHVDTGFWQFYDGSAWKPVTVEQRDSLNTMLLFEIRDLLADDD